MSEVKQVPLEVRETIEQVRAYLKKARSRLDDFQELVWFIKKYLSPTSWGKITTKNIADFRGRVWEAKDKLDRIYGNNLVTSKQLKTMEGLDRLRKLEVGDTYTVSMYEDLWQNLQIDLGNVRVEFLEWMHELERQVSRANYDQLLLFIKHVRKQNKAIDREKKRHLLAGLFGAALGLVGGSIVRDVARWESKRARSSKKRKLSIPLWKI